MNTTTTTETTTAETFELERRHCDVLGELTTDGTTSRLDIARGLNVRGHRYPMPWLGRVLNELTRYG